MKKSLVLNRVQAEEQIQKLTCNLVPSKARFETLEDRTYTVVPMVILTEGVHAGSEGPLYYPKDELAKTPAAWDHKPIVVYHPELNGVGISACNPTVINSRKVGLMMNTRWDGKGRLKSEAWIEADRANRVDERVMAAVERNEMMELSTGVFVDMEKEEGEWKGETYIGIARNYRPDHLALLPDKVGACSIKDGAGFLRNQEGNPDWMAKVRRTLEEAGLLDNEMSHDSIRMELVDALKKKFPGSTGNIEKSPWIENVYSNFVIYAKDGKLFRLGYTSGDNGVVLADEQPTEVKRVTEYRTVEGAFVGNQNQQQEGKNMDKQKLIAAIISNDKSSFTEEDREKLEALSEAQLTVINGALKEEKPPTATTTNNTPAPAANAQAGQATSNAQPNPPAAAPVTVVDFIGQAPKEIQEVLNNGLEIYNEEKRKLVDAILNHKRNSFTKDELDGRPLGELKRIARLAQDDPPPATRTANYAGQGPVPTGNTAEVEEAMEMPVINFSK